LGGRFIIRQALEFSDRKAETIAILEEEYINSRISKRAPMPKPFSYEAMLKHSSRKKMI